MKANVLSPASAVLLVLISGWPAVSEESAPQAERRAVRLDYRFVLKGIERGAEVRLWLPVPRTDAWQTVEMLPPDLPAEPEFHVEPEFCNRILYCKFSPRDERPVRIDVPYRIVRRAVRGPGEIAPNGARRTCCRSNRDVFLQADALVPIAGRPLELLGGQHLVGTARERARSLFDLVDAHVTYSKRGEGWGRGDVLWVCDSRHGNCSDFHSLFISLARSQGIPARFEIGFPIPPETEGAIDGYHCWAWFESETGQWLPVDISEADKHPQRKNDYFGRLTADRVALTEGRDINLVPRQDGPPLNFFIYPHVEVAGKPLPPENLHLQIGFREVEYSAADPPTD